MPFFKGRRAKTLQFVAAFGVSAGLVWLIRSIKSTREILSNAVDSSIFEVYEPTQSTRYALKNPNDLQDSWVASTYNATVQTFRRSINLMKFVFAQRLLDISQCDNQALRMRAVEHLTQLDLEKWHYSIIAHMCDARTAVGIARSTVNNEKYFLPTPRRFGMYSDVQLLQSFKEYFRRIYEECDKGHPCVEKTFTKIVSDTPGDNWIVDSDQCSDELNNLYKATPSLLPSCLETLRHHSAITKYSKDIFRYNGLYLLMEVYNRNSDNIAICIVLCNIIANISTHTDQLDELFKAGWISVLAKWMKSPDIRLSGPAIQALANLDGDDVNDTFSDIYLLHPKMRSQEKITVDVIFIHGLLGNVFYTWRNNQDHKYTLDLIETIGLTESNDMVKRPESSDPATREYFEHLQEQIENEWKAIGQDFEFVYYDIPENVNNAATGPYSHSKTIDDTKPDRPTQCWPCDWLPHDCKNLRVLGVNYNTKISVWAHMCPEISPYVTLDERTHMLIDNLIKAGVGKRPVIWVTHSMGGILAKNVLTTVCNMDNPKAKNILKNSKAIFFYSTPHAGSKMASFNQTTSMLMWPSMEVTELREKSPILSRIHQNFLELLIDHPIKVWSFVETRPTVVSALKLNFTLVEPASGNPGIGEYFEVPQNHLGICKPTNRESFLYQKVLQVIKKIVKDVNDSKP